MKNDSSFELKFNTVCLECNSPLKRIVFTSGTILVSQCEKCSDKAPLICECGDHIKDGDFHIHKDGKNYCEMCAEGSEE